MAAIKETLGAFRQLESAPPPPPEPLPPPESEPEESDDDLGADDSSAYSEYENEHEVPDEDMSTVAPSDASVLIYTISERLARYRATEAARRRWSDTISAANEEARVRARDTEDRWSTNSDAGGRRGYIRYDYPIRTHCSKRTLGPPQRV